VVPGTINQFPSMWRPPPSTLRHATGPEAPLFGMDIGAFGIGLASRFVIELCPLIETTHREAESLPISPRSGSWLHRSGDAASLAFPVGDSSVQMYMPPRARVRALWGLSEWRGNERIGLSTGPKTTAGRAKIAEAQRRRWSAFRAARGKPSR
jgi:hypothetical protein